MLLLGSCNKEFEPDAFYTTFRIVDNDGNALTSRPGVYHSDSIMVEFVGSVFPLTDLKGRGASDFFTKVFNSIAYSKSSYSIIQPLSSSCYLNYQDGTSDTISFNLTELGGRKFEGKVFLNGDSVGIGNSIAGDGGFQLFFDIVK